MEAVAYNRFCRKTLSEIGIWYSKPLILPSKGCVKGSFFLFFQHTIEPRKKKGESLKIFKLFFSLHFPYKWAENLISKNFIALESENNKFQDFSVIPYVHVLAIIACYSNNTCLGSRYLEEEINSGLSDLYL